MEVRRLRPVRLAPLVITGLLAATAVAASLLTNNALHRSPSGPEAQVIATALASNVTAGLQTQAAQLATAEQVLGGLPGAAVDTSAFTPDDPAMAFAVGKVTEDGIAFDVVHAKTSETADALRAIDVKSRQDWRLPLELARDGGTTVATTVGDNAAPAVLQVKPLYGSGSTPTDVAARRRSLAGYVLFYGPARSFARLGTTDTGARIVTRLVDGNRVLSRQGDVAAANRRGSPATASVNVQGVNWEVDAWRLNPHSLLPWLILVAGLLTAAAVGAIVATGRRRSDALAGEATARANELGLVARTGQLLQQSLDVGEILPSFVVEVSDELGLEAVSIAMVAESGELVEGFSLRGGASDLRLELLPSGVPQSVPPGTTVVVPLQRAGRVIGALSAGVPNGLSISQCSALRAVCDLLAAALANARLLQREQAMVLRLRDLDRMKTIFIGSVSHELRTAATAIQGFAELLEVESGASSGPSADYISRIQRNSRTLAAMVENLLDFARMERAGLSVSASAVDLSSLVPQIVEQVSSIMRDHPVHTNIAQGVVADADPGAIERILVNLLSNAAKYSPRGTTVDVTVQRTGSLAVLCVADHGPGIPLEERDKVFELFYRIDNETARSAPGTGMGLALVQKLVGLLGGSVTIEETPGGGAMFRVQVPLTAEFVGTPIAEPVHPL